MELTQKQKGNLTELQCLTSFIEQGLNVSIPYGDNARYDFVIDIGNEGAIHFSCKSSYTTNAGVSNVRYTKDEIDFFATFWKGICYLIPVQECSLEKTLRLTPPKNGQIKGITFASEDELIKQLEKTKGGSNEALIK